MSHFHATHYVEFLYYFIFLVVTYFQDHIKSLEWDIFCGILMLPHSMSSCSAAVRRWAVQWVLCVMCQLWEWVGRQSSSQARQAGVDQLCDTATPEASRPREGSQVQLPRLLGAQEPWPSLCVWLSSSKAKTQIFSTSIVYIWTKQHFFYIY